MPNFVKTKIIVLLVFSFFLLPLAINADTFGQRTNFFIDQSYDGQGRERILANLERVSLKGYFYLESDWLQNLTEGEKVEVNKNLETLAQEFDNTIYPKLTEVYGPPWEPGIDNNYTVTILFHKMKEEAGGYFNNGDEYSKLQNPKSNEREMVYLNADYLKFGIIKSFLAHEFTHLITFNQKERLRGVPEEIWLNEARADFSPTLLGYDQDFQGSNLQQRVKQFVASPNNSLTEWQNQKADYGVVNLFSQYLVDHYGIKILADSLQSDKAGIASLNYALAKNGFGENFSQIFENWTIAVFLNDCNLGQRYCYKSENLKNLKIIPSLIFLPSTQKTSIALDYSIKQWSGNWYRIIGGQGDLKIKFDGADSVAFKIPYVLCRDTQNCSVQFLNLDERQKGEFLIKDFGKNWSALTLLPSIQSKTSGFSNNEPLEPFSILASIEFKTEQDILIEELKGKIAELQAKIAEVQNKIDEILGKKFGAIPAGFSFEKNLVAGATEQDVVYLKTILANEGCLRGVKNTKWFGPATLAGVKCLCQKYKEDISNFAGSNVSCSGFVGKGIRAKLNQLISK